MSKKVRKTIRMPQATLDLWLHHLRSGKVKQGAEALFDGRGYCCLGVLQCAVSGGRVEYVDNEPAQMPSLNWLDANGISFLDLDGHQTDGPYLPTMSNYATEENDNGASFSELADAIEACAVGY